jgi:hypothetical protein
MRPTLTKDGCLDQRQPALRGRSLAHAPHVVVEPLLIRRLELLAWRAAKHLRKRSVQRGSIMLDLEKHAF